MRQVDLEPKVVRTDAIQAFVRQETILVSIVDDKMTLSRVQIEDGHAVVPMQSGQGIEWNWHAIGQREKASLVREQGS